MGILKLGFVAVLTTQTKKMTEKEKRETVRNDDVEGAVVFNVFVLMFGFVAGHFFSCP